MAKTRRGRKTPKSVYWGDRAAKSLITLSGIGAIIAVSLVGIFLVYVALPLFTSTQARPKNQFPQSWQDSNQPLFLDLDEYQTIAYALFADGRLKTFRLDNGETLEDIQIFEEKKITAFSHTALEPNFAFGFEDGSLQLAHLEFKSHYFEQNDLPEHLRQLEEGHLAPFEKGVLSKTPEGQFRYQSFSLFLEPAMASGLSQPIRLLDHSPLASDNIVAVAMTDNAFKGFTIEKTTNLLTGQTAINSQDTDIALSLQSNTLPRFLRLNGQGSQAYLAWQSGHLQRYNLQDFAAPFLAERVQIQLENDAELTQSDFLIGKSTLLAAESGGQIRSYFSLLRPSADTKDHLVTVQTHQFKGGSSAITQLDVSKRTRTFAAGFADGNVQLYQATAENLLASFKPGASAIRHLKIAPKDDAVWTLNDDGMGQFDLDLKHPEATFKTLFLPVWYEGYKNPEHVWQSSSGSDDFEPKLGLMPLIFGSLKATFYSLIFGVPIALLAAVYTSEFMNPRLRTKVKEILEIMASLPSVVLGFLAASIFSPFVENVLPAVMVSVLMIPAAFLAGAYLWQFIPSHTRGFLKSWRLLFIFLFMVLGMASSLQTAPILENLFFAGNMKLWLDGQAGSSLGGWFYLFIPLGAIGAFFYSRKILHFALSKIRPPFSTLPEKHPAIFDLLRFGFVIIFGLILAFAMAFLTSTVGFDPRQSVFGTYVQRNALVVGFVMGFAIIPIIYTLAEDALTMVPNHLRTASLGSGATPWQTARYVVIPAAMSGIFSAVMIGLGRAVGETMIVLMAAGNTPIMQMNIFNGFRTLSANIAVELPEAVIGDTHYRTLFLSGLILFGMTSVLNTLAEFVRLRFRKKVAQL